MRPAIIAKSSTPGISSTGSGIGSSKGGCGIGRVGGRLRLFGSGSPPASSPSPLTTSAHDSQRSSGSLGRFLLGSAGWPCLIISSTPGMSLGANPAATSSPAGGVPGGFGPTDAAAWYGATPAAPTLTTGSGPAPEDTGVPPPRCGFLASARLLARAFTGGKAPALPELWSVTCSASHARARLATSW